MKTNHFYIKIYRQKRHVITQTRQEYELKQCKYGIKKCLLNSLCLILWKVLKVLAICNNTSLTTENHWLANVFKESRHFKDSCCCFHNSCYEIFSRGAGDLVHRTFQEFSPGEIYGGQVKGSWWPGNGVCSSQSNPLEIHDWNILKHNGWNARALHHVEVICDL